MNIYHDDESGKTFNRPKWNEIKQYIQLNRGKVDKILFMKWDRFSRNQTDALIEIRDLKKYGVEPYAIEQKLDMNVPESKLILAVYLAAPEVDNDRRALNILNGMRRAKMEGRWMGACLRGYKNRRDEANKPIMSPEGGLEETLVRKAFTEFATGKYNIEELRKKLIKDGLKVDRSSFHRLLRNKAYTGMVYVPPFQKEEGKWIKAIHEPLVDMEVFEQVQDILEGRIKNRKPNKCSTQNDLMPLRGFLTCSQCGKLLTGSGSRGKSGKRFYYYHCHSGCKERQNSLKINQAMEEILEGFEISENLGLLIGEIIKEKLGSQKIESFENKKLLMDKIRKAELRLKNASDLYLDGELDKEVYFEMKDNLKTELAELNEKLKEADTNLELSHREITACMEFFQNIGNLYRDGDTSMKQIIVSSMFTEKLTFSKFKCRTPQLSEAASLIRSISKGLEGEAKKKHAKNSVLSHKVVWEGIEPPTQGFSVLCSTD